MTIAELKRIWKQADESCKTLVKKIAMNKASDVELALYDSAVKRRHAALEAITKLEESCIN